MSHRLLILNPGSTSTKAAVYDGEHQTAMKSIVHTNQDLAPYPSLYDQLDYRVTACGTTRCSTTPPTWAG